MNRPVQRIIAVVIGLVFLVAGALKLRDPAEFAIDIQNYRLLPWTAGVLLALYLPWVEILCGLGLIFGRAYRGALCITGLLLGTFIVAFGSTRPRGLDVACGCFGHGVHRDYWELLIGDALLLALVVWLLKEDLRPLSPIVNGNGQAEENRP